MTFELRWLNCLWLMVPLLAWNIILAPKITLPKVISDANSPPWLLAAENITRIIVFAFPLILPLRFSRADLEAFSKEKAMVILHKTGNQEME